MNTGFVIGLLLFLSVGAILNALDTGWNWLDCAVERDHIRRNSLNDEDDSEVDSGVAMAMWGLNND
tara:strand:+ start:271 stop:468 length:198 start_codon:yes stop_codon:yes gene_type:complete